MSADQGPNTAIVVGSGCSVGLGIPPLAGFLDTLIDKLAKPGAYNKSEQDLLDIQAFITRIKGAAAYIHADLLNIEELYGMADMDEDLWKATGDKEREKWYIGRDNLTPSQVKMALNRAIYFLAEPAGKEFINKDICFPKAPKELEEVKRESASEATIQTNQGTYWTNLLAYLCLASFQDRGGRYPLYIQFNWDLALDRALFYLKGGISKQNKKWLPWYGDIANGSLNYYDVPRLARPHGGLNWIDAEPKDRQVGSIKPIPSHKTSKLAKSCFLLYPTERNKKVWIDTDSVCNKDYSKATFRSGDYMAIVPPTWRKQATEPAYEAQWGYINQGLQHVRRIIFIGYSLPKTDLYFRHFLALSLADNPHLPKVYVVNPEINNPGGVRENFLDLFEPLAREGRLYGVAGRFGDPALFDLHRVFKIAKPILPAQD